MNRSIVAVGAVLLVAMVGLMLFTQTSQVADKAVEIRDKSIASSDKVSSYSYSIVVKAVSKGTLDGKQVEVNTTIEGNGTIDLRKRFMYTPVSMNVVGHSGEEPIETKSYMEMYILSDTLYSNAGQMWVKQKLKEDAWSGTQLSQQNDVIRNASVKLVGEEEVNGKKAYVIELKPDLNALMSYAVEIAQSTPSLEASMNKETVEYYKITEWISAESFLPLKTVNEFTVSSEDIRTTMRVVSEYYDYGKQVNAELPDEVLDAKEL